MTSIVPFKAKGNLKESHAIPHEVISQPILKWSPAALRKPMSQLAGEAPSEDKIVGNCVHSNQSE